ncbi:MAG: D-alanyl-D-alanine carboxypeptidase family protein [Oscillospiraceae bacterium]|nr:D-alanyl-D-alanine carboxypeptidase family protein [Oscillospiraceae bacterium]
MWESDNPAVAEVDDIGRITAVGAGTCTVRVTSVSNPRVFAEVQITVKEGAAVTTTLPLSTPPQTVPDTSAAPETTSGSSTAQSPASSEPASSQAAPATTATQPAAPRSDIEVINGITYVQGVLIVNKTYSLPSSYNPGGLTPEAQAAFNEMAAAAKKDGYTLTICSGFRSYSYQKQLYSNYVTRKGQYEADRCSARAGHSEHQTGLAMDINYAGSSFDNTPEAKWLGENCWKYGFIIRYPKGKEEITGYKYESWHVRYLGKEWAKTIYDSGLTLEEYFGITSKYAE